MAICKDCFHFDVCKDATIPNPEYKGVVADKSKECRYFKNKADVEEVKHGEWKVEFHNGKKFITCSACGSVIDCYATYIDENEYNGCPYCRAKMDGKRDKSNE